MDERQQQIRAGAGLEESRLNTEFIDFIQKWGGPFLIICALLMGAWAGWNWLERKKSQRLDEAFGQYEAQLAGGNPSPEALRAVAEEFSGIASVSLLARLNAADIYLAAIRSGVRTGATLNPDGSLASPDDALTPEDRQRLMAQAAALYQAVADAATASTGRALIAIDALHGLAVLAECRGDIDAAKAQYERIVQIASQGGYEHHARLARARIDSLPELAGEITLPSAAELAVRPAADPFNFDLFNFDPSGLGELPSGLTDPLLDPFSLEGGLPAGPVAPGLPEPQPEPGSEPEPQPVPPAPPSPEPAPGR